MALLSLLHLLSLRVALGKRVRSKGLQTLMVKNVHSSAHNISMKWDIDGRLPLHFQGVFDTSYDKGDAYGSGTYLMFVPLKQECSGTVVALKIVTAGRFPSFAANVKSEYNVMKMLSAQPHAHIMQLFSAVLMDYHEEEYVKMTFQPDTLQKKIGMTVADDGTIEDVLSDGFAHQVGVKAGMQIDSLESADADIYANCWDSDVSCTQEFEKYRLGKDPYEVTFTHTTVDEEASQTRTIESLRSQGMDTLVLIAEFVGGGTLHDSYKELSLGVRMRLFRQTLQAVAELHRLGIRHGDLKPEQVLLTESDCTEESCYAKLGDFGSSCVVAEHATLSGKTAPEHSLTVCGLCTGQFKAPELYKEDEDPILESDNWSLGAMLYELVMEKPLLSQKDSESKWSMSFPTKSVQVSESVHDQGGAVEQVVTKAKDHLSGNEHAQAVAETLGSLVGSLLQFYPGERMSAQAAATSIKENVLQPLRIAEASNPLPTEVPDCFKHCVETGPPCSDEYSRPRCQ